jgi:FixJ family two-component response regulator
MTARTFASAEEFLDAETPPPDCLILDVRMPGGLGGTELQQHLASRGSTIPIVFITAHEDEQTRAGAMSAGAVAFLRKPFDDETLLGAVARATKQRPDEGSR